MKKHVKQTSLFQLLDRRIFNQLVEKWEMDKWVREFTTWEMTCALITAMTLQLGSYRDIEQALGIPRATLGDAMARRFSGFFTELCDEILICIRGRTKNRKVKKAIRQILALDSSEIKVHGSLFSSPGWQQKSTIKHQAAAKLHVMWDVEGQWIDDYLVTGQRHNDSPISRLFELKSGVIYVFDRAYSDAHFWLDIQDAGSDFVSRLKGRSIKKLEEGKSAELKKSDGVLYDGTYVPCGATKKRVSKRPNPRDLKFRYIVYRDPETKKTLYFVTSNWRLSAQMIADIYKKRWAVELLFRWLKGHLHIRYLAVKNKNAVRIQLAIAVLVQLLLQLRKLSDRLSGTLWEMLRQIRTDFARKVLTNSGPPAGCRWKSPPEGGFNAFSV